MFALVKFKVQCSRHDMKNIVPVTKINHFDADNIDHRKYYNIKCGPAGSYCQAIILCVDDTIEKLRAKSGEKRQVAPPSNLILSASEISSEDSDALAKRAKKAPSRHESQKIKLKLNEKLEALRQKHVAEDTMTPVGNEVNTIEDDQENIEPGEVHNDKKNMKKSGPIKRKATDADGCGSGKKSTRSHESFGEPVAEKMTKPQKPNSSADKVREAQSSILTEPNAMTPDDVELSKNKQSPDSGLDVGKKSAQSPKALDKPMVEKIVKPAKKPDSSAVKKKGNRSSSMTAKDSNTSAARKTTDNTLDSKNMNSGCDDLSHADLLQQIKNLKAKCSKDETTIASQNLMMKELTTLNMELQRDVIQYFKEFKVMSEQYDGVIRNLEGCNAPPPGHISNDKIHLGHNVWIPYSTYNGAVNRAKSNQMFVKEIAVAVFGYDVLKNSSITGTQSNKFKDKPAKAKLDETKMLAISDIYRHRLLAIQKASEFNTQMELSKVNLYVTRKISDLNKLKKTDKPSTSSMTSSVPGKLKLDHDRVHVIKYI
ncbi:uncharacterized protein LOC124185545 [Neodiprion fabricii]|uniref:uncharacterized protein LOC124185545 n=1 Tax=Neodiprion fabricii TaxID=2872261 RepID=UPI001ED9527E|nr:uncharacterized protein LOC124185545 [Neodiprion fabricii]